MPDRTCYVIRVYDRGQRGPKLVDTVPAADETACLSAARAFAKEHAGAVALSVAHDPDGQQVTTEIARYGTLRLG